MLTVSLQPCYTPLKIKAHVENGDGPLIIEVLTDDTIFYQKKTKVPQNFIAYTESLIHAHFVHLKILFGNCVNSCRQLSDTSFPVKIKIIHIHLYPTLSSTTNIHFITCSCHHLTHIFTFFYIQCPGLIFHQTEFDNYYTQEFF